MTQTRSLRWLSVGVVVCLMITILVTLPAMSTAASQSQNEKVIINESGTPGSIQLGESRQRIRHIEILPPNQTENTTDILLDINLASIESRNVNTSSVSISTNGTQNAVVTDTQQLNSQNGTFVRATIRPDGSNRPIRIESIQIYGINTSSAQMSQRIDYDMRASLSSDVRSDEISDYSSTNSFKLIDGTIKIPDQATASPQLHQNTRTTAGVTVGDIRGNVNSTLFLTRGDENEIIGVRSVSKNTLKMNHSVSINTPYLGGDVKGFLIANSTLGPTNYDIRDNLPPNVTRSSLSSDKGRVVTASVGLANLSYNSSQTDHITVSNAKVSDTINDNTSFIVSLHPINSTGYILQNVTVASSKVLTGWNSNINLYFNTTTDESGIYRTNRYAASIQLSRGYNSGDWVSPKDLELLPNSDLNHQFVVDGVADYGVISVEDPHVERMLSSNDSVSISDNNINEPVYSGQFLYFNSTSPSGVHPELHRVDDAGRSRVVALGTELNDTSQIGYNTSMLTSGKYHVHTNNTGSIGFNIVGDTDKNIEFADLSSETTFGDKVHTSVLHSVPSLELALTKITRNDTIATIELRTSDTGPTPVTINTYASPKSPSDFVTTGPGVDVESVTGSVDSLSPGTYDLTLRSEHGTAVANDTATVTVNRRSTTGLTAYTTDTVGPAGFDDASAIRKAIADGTLTEATTATANDTVVYAVNATGLTGLPAAANASLERGADLDRLDGLSFGVKPTNGSEVNDTAERDALGSTPNESAVHLDRDGLFVVADGETAFGTEAPPEAGETFEAAFRVTDEALRRAAADDRHRVTTRLTAGPVDPVGEYVDNETDDGSTTVSTSGNETDDGSTTISASGNETDDGSTGVSVTDNETENGSTTVSASGNGTENGSTTVSASDNGTNTSLTAVSTTGDGASASSTSAPVPVNESTGGSVPAEPETTDRPDPQAGTGGTGGATGDTAPVGSSGGGAATGGPDASTNVGNATDAGGPDASGGRLDSAANRSAPPLGIGVTTGSDFPVTPSSAGPPAVVTAGVAPGADRSAVEGSVTPGGRADGGRGSDAGGSAEPDGPAESSASGDSSAGDTTASDLGYDDAPIRSTAYDLPGFDPLASLAGLVGASLLARRRAAGR